MSVARKYRVCCVKRRGTTAVFELQSLPHQRQCRCCVYFRFSVIRIPFPFRFLVSPPFPHSHCITHPVYHLQLQRESGASRILFTTCSYSRNVVIRTAGVLVSKSTNISFSSVIISAKKWWIILVLCCLECSLLRWRWTTFETITADMLQTVWNELHSRVDVRRITKGAHIEHL